MTYTPGHLLLDKYRIDALIGQGVFGDVYRAVHLKLNQVRAIKVLRRDMPGVSSEDFRKTAERFQFEAQLGARLDHPNVIKVHDFEEADGELYLVMEYAPSGNLQDRLKNAGPLSISDAVRLGAELCAGLDALHSKLQAVHRDVKPSNILFGENGVAKIADLGLAQALDGASQRSQLGSLAGTHPGTPLYMSPEQGSSRDYLLPTSDVFAVGCVLFEALTGKAYKSAYGSRTRDHRTDVPLWLDAIVARALAEQPGRLPEDDTNPAKRYREVRQVRNALVQGWQAQEREKKTQAEAAEKARLTAVSGQRQTKGQQPAPVTQSFSKWLLLIPLGIVVLGVIGGILSSQVAAPDSVTQTLTVAATRAPTTALPTDIPTTTRATPEVALPTTTPTGVPAPAMPTDMPVTVTPVTGIGSTLTRENDGMVMVYVPEGPFSMGGYGEFVHTVTLDAFWLDKTEVTNAMYAICVKTGVCQPPAQNSSDARSSYYGNPSHADYPVIYVGWNHAKTYCEWAGAELPSEAQWEKAARGVDQRSYPWGNTVPTCALANFWPGNTACVRDTNAVGKYPNGASPYGALDMAGNVQEWVADWYDPNYYQNSPSSNPTGPTSGDRRVVRGGYWGSHGPYIHSAYRFMNTPMYSTDSIGFRCARSK